MTADSPIVEEVRQRAQALSTRFNHDLNQYATHLRQIESSQRSRVVNQVTVVKSTPGSAAPPAGSGTRKS